MIESCQAQPRGPCSRASTVTVVACTIDGRDQSCGRWSPSVGHQRSPDRQPARQPLADSAPASRWVKSAKMNHQRDLLNPPRLAPAAIPGSVDHAFNQHQSRWVIDRWRWQGERRTKAQRGNTDAPTTDWLSLLADDAAARSRTPPSACQPTTTSSVDPSHPGVGESLRLRAVQPSSLA